MDVGALAGHVLQAVKGRVGPKIEPIFQKQIPSGQSMRAKNGPARGTKRDVILEVNELCVGEK